MSCVTPDLLAYCLDEIEAGRTTLDKCVAAHPEVADELAELLQTVAAIGPGPAVEPDPNFRLRGRSALLTAIAIEQGAAAERPWWRRLVAAFIGRSEPGPVVRPRQAEMPLPVFLVLAMLVGGGSAGISLAAEDSLPGEPLYALKAVTEVARLRMAGSAQDQADVHLVFAARRLDEMERLNARGQTAAFKTTAEQYNYHIHRATDLSRGQFVDRESAVLADQLSRRQEVLVELQRQAPQSAQGAIGEALQLTQSIESPDASPATKVAVAAPVAPAQPSQPTPTPAPAPAVEASRSLEELKTVVVGLADSQAGVVDGQSELVATINSAQAAVERGKPEEAADDLTTFANRLNALQLSGRISGDLYQHLYKTYALAVGKVGANMSAKANPGSAPEGSSGTAPSTSGTSPAVPSGATSSPSATGTAVQPTAQPTPTPAPTPVPPGSDRKPTVTPKP